jgi:hypothetical protein
MFVAHTPAIPLSKKQEVIVDRKKKPTRARSAPCLGTGPSRPGLQRQQLSFAERDAQAALIVRGKVVSLEAVTRGVALASGERKQKDSTARKAFAANQSLGLGPAIEELAKSLDQHDVALLGL